MDKKDYSINTASSSRSLSIQVFESVEAFKMYYAIGASMSSLHRESTDSVNNYYKHTELVNVINLPNISNPSCLHAT